VHEIELRHEAVALAEACQTGFRPDAAERRRPGTGRESSSVQESRRDLAGNGVRIPDLDVEQQTLCAVVREQLEEVDAEIERVQPAAWLLDGGPVDESVKDGRGIGSGDELRENSR
jgi:hypothetical protein